MKPIADRLASILSAGALLVLPLVATWASELTEAAARGDRAHAMALLETTAGRAAGPMAPRT